MPKNSLLIIGHTFPEPSTTAAGIRMMQLIEIFKEDGYIITFGSTARSSQRSVGLSDYDVEEVSIALNDVSFDDFIFKLNPSVVIFDRYVSEEKFGWRVAEQCPNALKILDTEDLHFLRLAREEAFKKKVELNLYSNTAKRELASILRCDISLIISEVEVELLRNTFNIPEGILYYLPFLVNPIPEEKRKELPSFEDRTNFITIGNMLHTPNVDSILFLKKEIWPFIRLKCPKAELFVYGNYGPQQIIELHNPKEGFLIQGWAENAHEVMQKARVCLAPLRFGAGLKGKLFDAMLNGTPFITTKIGAEGIQGDLSSPGIISDEIESFVSGAISLYSEKDEWTEMQTRGFEVLEKRFKKDLFSEAFIGFVHILRNNVHEHREENFFGQILQHQTMQASKYMSKWIEQKNKK